MFLSPTDVVAAECGKSRSNLEMLRIVKQSAARKMHKLLLNRDGAVHRLRINGQLRRSLTCRLRVST